MQLPPKFAPGKRTTTTTTTAIAEAIGMDAQTAIDAARLATAAAARIPAPPPDPIYRTLAQAEQGALRRFSPRRSWPEHDEKIAEADRDREIVRQRIQDLRAQLSLATVQDEQRLVAWLREERGERPVPSAPALEQEIAQAEAELVARAAIVTQLEADKETFVVRHRKRLFMDATSATEAARVRYIEAIDSLASIREEIRSARQATIFAQLYPSANTGSEPPASLIAGRLDVMRKLIPGLASPLDLGGLLALLREDATYVTTAATSAQASEIAGRDITQPTAEQGGAVWVQTDEGLAVERTEKKAALERYKRDWGTYPA